MDKYMILMKMRLKGITQTQMSELLGITPVTFSRKLNGQSEFKMSEIVKMAKALEVPASSKIFFSKEVTESN